MMAARAPKTAWGMYRALMRAVERFTPEPILAARSNEAAKALSFTEAAKAQIRKTFKDNANAGAAATSKLLVTAEKELAALQSLANNECILKYPGPPRYEKLYKGMGKTPRS